MAEATRRLFLALWPEPALAEQLQAVAAAASKVRGGRQMHRDTLHLTLAFLGDVPQSSIPALIDAMGRIDCPPFRIDLDRLAYWRHNRIVWAGCSMPPEALDRLVADIRLQLAPLGLPGSVEAFSPHVTLLRKAGPVGELPVMPALVWLAREWVLVESRPSIAGADYQPLATWPLRQEQT